MDTSLIQNQKSPKNQFETIIDYFIITLILIVLIISAYFGLLLYYQPRSTAVSPDISYLQPTNAPIQAEVRGEAANPIVWDENRTTWIVKPRASFQISARVLGNKRYSDWQSTIVPRDLALGWGEMSDPAVDEWVHWRQSNRWYYYNWNNDSPKSGRYIGNHSANVHIVPATENLNRALREIQKDDIIYLEGFLVDIEAINDERSMRIKTSLSREDSGNGACEVLYVERLVWDRQLYE